MKRKLQISVVLESQGGENRLGYRLKWEICGVIFLGLAKFIIQYLFSQ